ncbi:type II toxin-antitoxin system VapC family toxin [Devosia aurantiaca]|uniref:VapC toxin family PIN domain ribonuclease n=1 Tax=Devosia aurantiaca TaxID=2714858 RepID=A0A6M1T2D5_9HYPH|nr:PIN domain-containing protein [Devosia aurantiaca]NGP18961.1 VapC toxin family PIN domain ribonuclease [Devosia aurantiaca]
MILADTSAWINHWRTPNLRFARMLANQQIVMHPFVVGELATGSLKERHKTLLGLRRMYTLRPVAHDDVLDLMEARGLFSRGVGYMDLHLLAAALANPPVRIMTDDRRFGLVVGEFGLLA